MDEKIIDFIQRRFAEDNHWAEGNCYWVAKILCEEFPFLEVAYLPVDGHFVAIDTTTGKMYDARGAYHTCDTVLLLSDIIGTDRVWYKRLMRDCRD